MSECKNVFVKIRGYKTSLALKKSIETLKEKQTCVHACFYCIRQLMILLLSKMISGAYIMTLIVMSFDLTCSFLKF